MIKQIPIPERKFTWFDVTTPNDEDMVRLSEEFHLPYLIVQDCLKPEHLPKYEETEEGHHFLMMRAYDKDSNKDDTTVQELTRKIALFITNDRLITIHRVELPYLDRVMVKCEKKPDSFPKNMQMLVHQVVLDAIRTYEEPINRLQDLYDDFETEVLSKKCDMDMMKVYRFRRQLFVLKRILKQTNDGLYRFKEFFHKHPSMLQDLRENIDQLYFQLDEVSDNFEHLLELQIQMDDQKANDVMKTLTVFSTVLLPLNFIASFYGMNFTHLPGLDSPHALAGISALMIVVWIVCLIYFRYRGWFKTRRTHG